MSHMMMPMVSSYFAIYTLENQGVLNRMTRGMNWDLHATAADKSAAISHARMLALQPGVSEVHVKEVTENHASGMVRVRDVTCCKRGSFLKDLISRFF